MLRPALWVAVVLTLGHQQGSSGCNVHELSRIVQSRFRQEVTTCGREGDQCSFDRDCCKGLECSMAASRLGIGSYCERRVRPRSERGDMGEADTGEAWDDYHANDQAGTVAAPDEPSSAEAWMLAEPGAGAVKDAEQEGDEGRPTDALGEIEQFQEKKRSQLVKENEELERLFTEKEENELEQLRALKEDAEMDELRRLKELRLKRKLDLLKELRELRGLRAEEYLDKIEELRNVTEQHATGMKTDGNVTDIDGQSSQEVPLDQVPLNNSETERQPTEQEHSEQPESTTKHRQGIHDIHHRHKHHQHKHKHPPNTTEININLE